MEQEKQDFDSEYSKYVDETVDELYSTLIRATDPSGAYDLRGRIAAGKELLRKILSTGRAHICQVYRANKGVARDSIDLVKVLADSIPVVLTIAGVKVPPVAVAVLLVKIGLEKVCPE